MRPPCFHAYVLVWHFILIYLVHITYILNSECRSAVHLGMTQDIPFLERPDWMANGSPKYKVYCPVTAAERRRRLPANERRSEYQAVAAGEAEEMTEIRSALEMQFDWELHQMTAYMRRLDGEGKTRSGYPRMDPLARDGVEKFATDGSRTPSFGFWFYVAWYNVIVPALSRTFGQVLNVVDRGDLDTLLGTTVMM